jgi:cholesterol transport system auxiliary component
MRLPLLATVAAALLAGCASGFERNVPEPRVYRLAAPTLPASAPLAADLQVLRPVVAPGLRTERIATAWPGQRLDYYAGARWSGELGALIQGVAVQALASSGGLRSVEGEPARFRASHVLALEVRRFEADYAAGNPPMVRVEMAARLGRNAERQVLATWTATGEAAAAANTLGEVTAAFDQAFAVALADIALKTHAAIAADLP